MKRNDEKYIEITDRMKRAGGLALVDAADEHITALAAAEKIYIAMVREQMREKVSGDHP